MELYAKNFAIAAHARRGRSRSPNVPADYEKRLVKNDFAWSPPKNRDSILAEWSKRYDAQVRAEVSA